MVMPVVDASRLGYQSASWLARTLAVGAPCAMLFTCAKSFRAQGALLQWLAVDQASAFSCTPFTARPEGSASLANSGSQAMAAGDEQAMDLPPGTVAAQASPG